MWLDFECKTDVADYDNTTDKPACLQAYYARFQDTNYGLNDFVPC